MRVYIVVRYRSKDEEDYENLLVYSDKHKAKAKAEELDNELADKMRKKNKRKKESYGIKKYDVCDLEEQAQM